MSGDFRSLAEEYGARVYTFALYTLRRREDAEDVTQEVLARLWQNREAVTSEGMTAWVMRVTRNLVIDVARRRRARAAVMAEGADAQIAAEFVASRHRADEDAERGELRGALERAVAGLEEPYRSIVVMREIQGLAYEEVAESLELPLGTVKAYLHRARRRLRDSVRKSMGEDGYDLS